MSETDGAPEAVPPCVKRVLDDCKDVLPEELPRQLPPRREVDDRVKLEPGKSSMVADTINPSGAPVLFQKKSKPRVWRTLFELATGQQPQTPLSLPATLEGRSLGPSILPKDSRSSQTLQSLA